MGPLELGLTLLFFGLAFCLLILFMLRVISHRRVTIPIPPVVPIPLDVPTHSDAVLLIDTGGRILYCNDQAREWFRLEGDEPNLERLSRRARPGEVFLSLCASEGQSHLSLDGRYLETSSYAIPYGASQAMLVRLHRPSLVVEAGELLASNSEARLSGQTLELLAELSQTMAASLDLERTLHTILESVERLIPADFQEINLWDAGNGNLVPYRLAGLHGLNRHLEKGSERFRLDEGYSGYLSAQRKPLLIANTGSFRLAPPFASRQRFPYQSYLGVPLTVVCDGVSGELIGTFEMASLAKEAFTENDLEILRLLSGQAAIALHNALLYEKEQRRALELSGLAQLAQAVSSLRDPQDLFSHLVDSLTPLLEVEVLGFLVFDENRRILAAQIPFHGLPPDIVELYRSRIEPDSPADSLWLSAEMISTEDAASDPRMEALELHHLAQAAGIRQTVLMPLTSAGHTLGYLQVANKRDGSPFGPVDLRLLTIIAGQAAPIIENAYLVQQSGRRAQRAETLRRIASLTASSASLDEALTFSLQDLARLLGVDYAAIFLVDETHGELRLHKKSAIGVAPEDRRLRRPTRLGRISMDDPQFLQTVTGSKRRYVSGNVQEDPLVIPLYRQIVLNLKIRSAVVVPLVVRAHGIGELMLGSLTPDYFYPGDVQTVITAAGQIAAAIERSVVFDGIHFSQTDENLQGRAGQFTALTRISREFNRTMGLEELLQRVFAEALRITQADCGTILLFRVSDSADGRPSPEILLHQGEPPLPALHALERLALEDEETQIVEDFNLARDGKLEHDPPHAGIRSALVAPILHQDRVAGLIHLHSATPHHFDESARQITDALAVQASSAIGYALRFQEQKDQGQRLSQRASRILAGLDIAGIVNGQPDRSSALRAFGQEILVRMELDTALIAELSPDGPRLVQSIGAVPGKVNPEALLGQCNPLTESLQKEELLLVSDLEGNQEWSHSPLLSALGARSFICLPILKENGPSSATADSALLAVSQRPLPPFTAEDEQLYSLLARQMAISLQNLSLISETSRRLGEVNLLSDFIRQLGSPSSSTAEPTAVLRRLAASALHVIPAAQASLVALWDPVQELLLPVAAEGYTRPERVLEIAFRPGEGLYGLAFQSRQALRLDEVDFARHYPLSSEDLLRYRDATDGQLPVSASVLPIQISKDSAPLGILLLENYQTVGAFTSESQAILASLAGQTALTLEHSRLYQAASERARQLQALTEFARTITSSLQPEELIAALLNQLKAILPYETGTLWIRQGSSLVVRAASGFDDSEERLGLSVAVEDSLLLKEMIHTSQPISVVDVRTDPRFPALPSSAMAEPQRLSWLGIPLIASEEVIGVIALEKTEAGYYTAEHIQIATTFAGQAVVALENAGLYQESLARTLELDQRSQRLALLNRFSTQLSGSLDLSRVLNLAVQELSQALSCSAVSAVFFRSSANDEPSGGAALLAESPLAPEPLPAPLPDAPIYDRLRQTRGIFTTQDVQRERDLDPLSGILSARQTRSLMILPLSTGDELHGLLLIHADHPHHFETDEINLARTLSSQAAIAIQNAKLYAETRSLTEDLERRVEERTSQLAREHRRTEILLRLITELSASLDLEQVLNRTLRVLNEMIDAEQVAVLIARPGEARLHHLASMGYASVPPDPDRLSPFDTGQGLAGWVIQNRKPVLIPDVRDDPRWLSNPGTVQKHRSAIGVPLMVGAEALGALLFFHSQVSYFSSDQLDLIQAAANQVAIAVNNAELYRLIRDQAEDLGSMLRAQQVEASRSRAILEAVADGVLVTDAKKTITLFNASAENILGLNRAEVIGQSLEHFIGLFSPAAQAWLETIESWSQVPPSKTTAHPSGAHDTEQITLEDGRAVSVNLAPVHMRSERTSASDFLGTVSTFRDITHQVEVNRLKSEFVATVSHELRTPMTSIKGYVEILLMGAAGALNEQQMRFLEVVRDNTDRLAALVSDLLDISRIESGRAVLSLQTLDLKGLAEEVSAGLRRRSQQDNKPMIIELVLPPELPAVYADPQRVVQILENLLDNAYRYTAENGRITLHALPAGSEVRVDVRDTGIGIPPERQHRVFERFYRGEHPYVLATSGTGLGLSIVKNLVEMHQGRIWLQSSGIPGEGSTFSFTLPIDKNC